MIREEIEEQLTNWAIHAEGTEGVIKAFNLGIEQAAENAEVRWVDNPKLSDPAHITAIVDKKSILELKLK